MNKYKFNDDTYIMIDRSDVNFSGVQYKINSVKILSHFNGIGYVGKTDPLLKNSYYHKNGVWVRITKKGLKTLEDNLNKLGVSVKTHGWSYEYILEFVSDELNRYLYFDSREENDDPEIYKQIMTLIYVCPKCQGDKEKGHKLCGWCQIGGNPEELIK